MQYRAALLGRRTADRLGHAGRPGRRPARGWVALGLALSSLALGAPAVGADTDDELERARAELERIADKIRGRASHPRYRVQALAFLQRLVCQTPHGIGAMFGVEHEHDG